MKPVVVASFGFLHLEGHHLPVAGRVEDVRRSLHDPDRVRGLCGRDGTHPLVRRAVLDTPGARELLLDLATYVLDLSDQTPSRSVAIGCSGGRHRSVVLVIVLAEILEALNIPVRVEHRHIHLPVTRSTGNDTT